MVSLRFSKHGVLRCVGNKSAFILLALILVGSRLVAQQTMSIVPPSPDAAALGQYGNIPVSTYTGIPNISIPLYSIDYRDVHIPIDLRYHSSGVTLETESSWVGMGWTLNVGGVITRTLRAGDDMQKINDGVSTHGSDYLYSGYPYDVRSSNSNVSYSQQICNKEIDAEPDMFYFNFHGTSGSFILENGQDITLNFLTGTPVNVEKIEIKYDKLNLQWQIRTADGYAYYFKTKEVTETHRGVNGAYGGGSDDVGLVGLDPTWEDVIVSAWYLDKMVTPLGEEVNYVYDTVDEIINGVPTGKKRSVFGSAQVTITDISRAFVNPTGTSIHCFIPPGQGSASKSFVNNIYLKEIDYSAGKIVFNKSLREDMMPSAVPSSSRVYLNHSPYYLSWISAGPQKLDNVVVQDVQGNPVKRFELEYGYFNADKTGDEKYSFRRLKLNKVRECGNSGLCNPYYQLYYDETHPLPSKYSKAQDFWGYNNGAINNISRIPYGTYYNPRDSVFYYLGDSDRQPNAEYMTSAILNKIVYPTGGSTLFEFEANDYFVFGASAFAITDFENHTTTKKGLAELRTTIDGPEYKTATFTLTDAVQSVFISNEMIYYPSATSSDPCNVVDPGTQYVGNEVLYSLRNLSSTPPVSTHFMSDFLNFFTGNYTDHCLNENSPDEIDPIYRSTESFTLSPGTYELKVYARANFNMNVIVSSLGLPSREIPLINGIYAKTAGGLRIKRITSRESPTSVPVVKRYGYTMTGNGKTISTGRLMLFPNHFMPLYCWDNEDPWLRTMDGHSWSNTPIGTSASGSIVGYDRVTEYFGENGENGKIEYNYINQEENVEPIEIATEGGITDSFTFIDGFPSAKNSSNGLVFEVNYFDYAGNKIKSQHSSYGNQLQKWFEGTIVRLIPSMHNDVISWDCNSMYHLFPNSYGIPSNRWVPTQKIDRVYSTEGVIETVTEYEYDTETHLQLKWEQSTSSKGELIKTIYSYPPDASWIPASMWQDKFIYDKVVKKDLFRNGSLLNSYKTYYSEQGGSYVVNKEESAFGASPFESLNTYTYSSGKTIQTVSQRDGTTRLYLWGYKNGYPVAEIRNATLTQVLAAMGNINEPALNAFAEEASPSSDYLTKIANLRTTLPGALIKTFSYYPLVGLKTITDENGNTAYYEYDTLGRLLLVKDKDGNVVKTHTYHYKQ